MNHIYFIYFLYVAKQLIYIYKRIFKYNFIFTAKIMILLEQNNRIICELLEQKFSAAKTKFEFF